MFSVIGKFDISTFTEAILNLFIFAEWVQITGGGPVISHTNYSLPT